MTAARHRTVSTPTPSERGARERALDDEQLQRYSRHLLLPEIDLEGQQRLAEATVLIVGAGGLGSPAAMYLAGSGVGHLVICDHDRVDLGNLQRQILHGTPDIGRLKTESARERLLCLNPGIRVSPLPRRLGQAELERQLRTVDVAVDATDNFETRFALSRSCVSTGTPLVWGAASRWQGQVTCFDHRRDDSPCLQCLYPDHAQAVEADASCAAAGVFAPLTGIIGSIMAALALKVLLGQGDTLCGRLWRMDALRMAWSESSLGRDPECQGCARATREPATG